MTVCRTSRTVFTAGVALALAAGASQAQTKWDMPTPYPDSNFHTKNVRQFADDIAKASGGKLHIAVHSGNSLIKHPEIKRAVQTGQVPIAEVLISILSNEAAVFAFDSNPFLANSYAKQKKLWAAAKPVIEKRLDGQGMTLLYTVAWPPTGFHTKKELNSLADFKGLRMRSYSAVTSRLAELAGAIPVLIAAPEVPQAFRTGMIDAQINSGAGGVDTQTWDSTTHMYNVQAILPHNVIIASKAALGALDPAIQKAVRDAATSAETRGAAASEDESTRSIQTLSAKGVKVVNPPAALAAELQEIGKKMTAEWVAKAGPEGEAILKAYGN
ncbi:MAG: C4-dicarboxylate ABC transporter substrate-binding protein [Betaproteobacteria bacterium]|nr:C4-dicarboxylate ABC transporter substrate-binding protein [Betaproteobacteria bacterium]